MGTVMDIHVTEVKKQEHECYCIPVGDPGGLGADHWHGYDFSMRVNQQTISIMFKIGLLWPFNVNKNYLSI